jgi:hypothetical protein
MSPRKTRAASPVIPFANPESGVKERATGQGISMIRDVFRIRALQHHDARVMLNGDNTNRRIRQELAHDAIGERIRYMNANTLRVVGIAAPRLQICFISV